MFTDTLTKRADHLLKKGEKAGLRIATAESCTGGLLSALLTSIPGSSHVFERGFVTYSNDAKCEMLDVKCEMIHEHGAVSEQVAKAMAEGALSHSQADIAIAITGIAGPGGEGEKPVGLVWFGVKTKNKPVQAECSHFSGERIEIQEQAVTHALALLEPLVSS